MEAGRIDAPSLRGRWSAAAEIAGVLLALLLLEYYYVASGLAIEPVVLGQVGLYGGVVWGVLQRFGSDDASTRAWRGFAVGVGVAGLAVAVLTAVVPVVRGVVLVALAGVGAWSWRRPATRTERVAFGVAVVSLGVVFGGFSPYHVGMSLVGTAPGTAVTVTFVAGSESAFLFGVETPVVRFSRPGFHAEAHLVPAVVGAVAYVLADVR